MNTTVKMPLHQIVAMRAKKRATLLRQQAAVNATEAELTILDEAERQLNADQQTLDLQQPTTKPKNKA